MIAALEDASCKLRSMVNILEFGIDRVNPVWSHFPHLGVPWHMKIYRLHLICSHL